MPGVELLAPDFAALPNRVLVALGFDGFAGRAGFAVCGRSAGVCWVGQPSGAASAACGFKAGVCEAPKAGLIHDLHELVGAGEESSTSSWLAAISAVSSCRGLIHEARNDRTFLPLA